MEGDWKMDAAIAQATSHDRNDGIVAYLIVLLLPTAIDANVSEPYLSAFVVRVSQHQALRLN